ncbi:hypothetical protein DH2020_048279 [Rehmannia glutinosa]|uniref:Retrotransposon Copia-like N-terminal domain-containing protein n=1 Tax=Rehmannia glutinosa TaxID=99300 RepID=A0ABR0U675_REHGL
MPEDEVLNTKSTPTSQSKIYVPNLSGNLVITNEKLIGSQNYQDWSSAVELWFMGQGVVDHLTTEAINIQHEKDVWERVDAQLCSLLWQSLSSDLIPMFRPFKTCFSVWKQAQALYTNDISRFYYVVSEMFSIKKSEMSMEKFLGKIQGLMAEFNKLMPVGGSPTEQLAQRDKFFVVFSLAKLEPEFEQVRNGILGDGSIPTTQEMFKRLLQVSSVSKENTSSSIIEHSALASQSQSRHDNNRGRGRGGNRGGRGGGRGPFRFCDFCHKPGHTPEECWKLHGKPPVVSIAQSKTESLVNTDSSTHTISKAEYEEFLQLKEARTTIFPDTSHTVLASQSNSFKNKELFRHSHTLTNDAIWVLKYVLSLVFVGALCLIIFPMS